MKTWPIVDEQGRTVAFEVSMIRIGLGEIAKVLQSLPGISQLHKRRPFSHEEVHIQFNYRGMNYVVWEPFGDNSRYWIGPADKTSVPAEDAAEIERAFRRYHSSLLKRFFGSMMSA
jgi:hypothetical protein